MTPSDVLIRVQSAALICAGFLIFWTIILLVGTANVHNRRDTPETTISVSHLVVGPAFTIFDDSMRLGSGAEGALHQCDDSQRGAVVFFPLANTSCTVDATLDTLTTPNGPRAIIFETSADQEALVRSKFKVHHQILPCMQSNSLVKQHSLASLRNPPVLFMDPSGFTSLQAMSVGNPFCQVRQLRAIFVSLTSQISFAHSLKVAMCRRCGSL